MLNLGLPINWLPFGNDKISTKSSFLGRFESKLQNQDTLKIEMAIRVTFKIKLTFLLSYVYYFSFINSLFIIIHKIKKIKYTGVSTSHQDLKELGKNQQDQLCLTQETINAPRKLTSAVCHQELQNSVWVPVSGFGKIVDPNCENSQNSSTRKVQSTAWSPSCQMCNLIVVT